MSTTEGVFAINKPAGITSAQAIRDLQTHFNRSSFFAPWLDAERQRLRADQNSKYNRKQRWKKQDDYVKVKLGHGGTLDPAATGVLIVGVGKGTKDLNKFLECTKSYDAVVIFGAATDSYDAEGKIIGRRPFDHVTKHGFEEALEKWRGRVKQKPPIFSALRMDGKRLYEYAREGKELPRKIEERDVKVDQLELLEWIDPGTHQYKWPIQEAEQQEQEGALKIIKSENELASTVSVENAASTQAPSPNAKRKRDDELEPPAESSKRAKAAGDDQPDQPRSGGSASTSKLNASDEPQESEAATRSLEADTQTTYNQQEDQSTSGAVEGDVLDHATPAANRPPPDKAVDALPPAARIRMTVSGGFYVRSLCHDLGLALDSFALMSNLIRTRQGDFELNDDSILEYKDLEAGEHAWAPKVENMLRKWNTR